MAGRGPAPKHPSARTRRNKPAGMTVLAGPVDATQPELPAGVPWPEQTERWWAMWGQSPQSAHFGPTDWDFLLDTALLHADVWSGNLDRLPELRLRVAKFGATPEDRARLKIQYADAEVAEDRAESAQERRAQRAQRSSGSADPRAALYPIAT